MSKNRFIVLASKEYRPKFIRKVIKHKSKLKRLKKLKEENREAVNGLI